MLAVCRLAPSFKPVSVSVLKFFPQVLEVAIRVPWYPGLGIATRSSPNWSMPCTFLAQICEKSSACFEQPAEFFHL